jgi:hypothetical protein
MRRTATAPWHAEREGKVYAIRDNWAEEQGLMRPNENGYEDAIVAPPGATQPKPGERDQAGTGIYCRCWYTYLYNLDSLPRDMLTPKGEAALERVTAA